MSLTFLQKQREIVRFQKSHFLRIFVASVRSSIYQIRTWIGQAIGLTKEKRQYSLNLTIVKLSL